MSFDTIYYYRASVRRRNIFMRHSHHYHQDHESYSSRGKYKSRHHRHVYNDMPIEEDMTNMGDPAPEIQSEYPEKQHNILSCGGLFTLITFLLSVLFLVLMIYAIFKYNTDAVKEVCPRLHEFLSMRTVIGVVFLSSILTYSVCTHHEEGQGGSPYFFQLFLVVYFLSFCVAGGIILFPSMVNNTECTNALEDDVFHMPMLGILGFVYFGFDSLFLILSLYLLLSSQMCADSAKKKAETHDEEDSLMTMGQA
jgi:hypothetical protein